MTHWTKKHWTKSQLQALDALGVPLYAPKQDTAQPTAEPQRYTYRLAHWTLLFEQRLPVDNYPWLNQLATHLGAKPAEVKADNSINALDVSPFAREHLSPDEKKQLWHSLSTWPS